MMSVLYAQPAAPLVDANGFTLFLDPPEGTGEGESYVGSGRRKVYISTAGVSSNPGTQAAPINFNVSRLQSLIRDGMPDAFYFKNGESYSGNLGYFNRSGRAPNLRQALLCSTWGTGSTRPRINIVVGDPAYDVMEWWGSSNNNTIGNIAIRGAEFYAPTRDPNNGAYVLGDSYKAAALISFKGKEIDFLHVEDCRGRYLGNGVGVFGPHAHYIGTGTGTVVVRRNIFDRIYQSHDGAGSGKDSAGGIGLEFECVQNLLVEENVIHYSGYVPGITDSWRNTFNHCIYCQMHGNPHAVNHIFRRNILSRGACYGLHARAGGIVEDNLLTGNAAGMNFGYAFTFAKVMAGGYCRDNRIRRNVVLESMGINQIDSTLPGGFSVGINIWCTHFPVTVEDNICAHSAGQVPPLSSLGLTFISSNEDPVNFPAPHGSTTKRNIINNWPASNPPSLHDWANIAYGPLNNADDPSNIEHTGSNYSDQPTWVDPLRTVGKYNQDVLGGSNSADAMVDAACNRAQGVWPSNLTASAVNDYVNAGYGRGSAPTGVLTAGAGSFGQTGLDAGMTKQSATAQTKVHFRRRKLERKAA